MGMAPNKITAWQVARFHLPVENLVASPERVIEVDWTSLNDLGTGQNFRHKHDLTPEPPLKKKNQ